MLSVIRPNFEVVKSDRILHFVSGERRFKLITIRYDQSSLVANEFELSNHILIKDMINLVKFSNEYNI